MYRLLGIKYLKYAIVDLEVHKRRIITLDAMMNRKFNQVNVFLCVAKKLQGMWLDIIIS